ncbi:hypothetical protein ACHQM5_010560 [Ranunculus cassubicifolius]
MELLAAAFGSTLTCMCNCVNTPVVEQCMYMNNPTKGISKLRNKKEQLMAEVDDVLRRLGVADAQGRTRTSRAENWVNQSNDFITKVNEIEDKAKVARRLLSGVSPNCCSRYDIGRCISKLINKANQLLEQASSLSGDSLAFLVPEMGMKMATGRLSDKTRTDKNLEMMLGFLMGDEISMICVYGMGGVGKTTLMKHVNNKLLEQGFDGVFWVTVSKDANVYKLQHDISKVLGLDLLHEHDETRRSSLLLKELQRRGRILLILDDLWSAFSLHEIGIPLFRNGDGCKLVLTTRSLDVGQMMGCKDSIKVEPLSDDEAWELFIETVDMILNPEIATIAKRIVKECSGLPLAVITVGGAMRGKEAIQEWRVALTDLKASTNRILDMEEQVTKRLQFSYNRLGDDIQKRCFLYCTLYPEDFKINPEELIDHWIMAGLVKGRTIQDELDQGQVILNKLKRCCLLEYGSERIRGEYVKMHDLIRDMALRLTKRNPQAGVLLEDFSDENAWGSDLENVSLIGSGMDKILVSPNCGRLSALLVNRAYLLKHIEHCFFLQMQSLQVLNLSITSLELLPDTLSDLVHLKILDFSYCGNLKLVPSVAKLQSLEVLRLKYTAIEELPHGIEDLVNLKRLDLRETRLIKFPASLISKFSCLKELLIHSLHVVFGLSFVDELLSLAHLENLSIDLNDMSDFFYYIRSDSFKHLDTFSFDVGHAHNRNVHEKRGRNVSICMDSPQFPEQAISLPQKTEFLRITKLSEVTRLSKLACLKGLRDLKECWVEECTEMEYILFSEDICLWQLEYINIKYCPKLISLFKGVATLDTLPWLKKMKIRGCHNLKYLFPFELFKKLQHLTELYIWNCGEFEELISEQECMGEVARTGSSMLRKIELYEVPKLKTLFSKRMSHYFKNLEEVYVDGCHEMRELIAEDAASSEDSTINCSRSNDNTITLPKLKTLHLWNLTKLKNIWKGDMVCDSIQSVKALNCSELKRLPYLIGEMQSPPPALKDIKGTREWWDTLEWDHSFYRKLALWVNCLFSFHRIC